MSSIIGSAAGTLIATYLPFDTATNMALGMAGNQLVTTVLSKFGDVSGWIWTYIGYSRNQIKVCLSEHGKLNPIYRKLEDYILDRYIKNLEECNVAPKKGEVMIDLREAVFKKPLEILYNGYYIYLTFSHETQTVTEKTSDGDAQKKAKTILIYSNKASIEHIKGFITEIAKLENKKSNVMTVYRVIMSSSKKESHPYWDNLCFQSNKTVENTILSKQVQKELFDDIELFMNSESLYSERGIDYKRGYMLFGPPGCGKSSSIKAIANKYNLPIFNLDLETVKTNSQLISLTNDILYEIPDRPYILTIEDFDRHEMFKDKWSYNGRFDKVTMQCLLNVIDGIVESHGRLLFITCNDKSKIEEVAALVRPGRIDRIVTLSHCDAYQASRLINNFFKSNVVIADDNIEEEVTPAELIKKMQTTQSVEAVLHYICKQPNLVARDQSQNSSVQLSVVPMIPSSENMFDKPSKVQPKIPRKRKPLNRAQKKKRVLNTRERKLKTLQKQQTNTSKAMEKLQIDIAYDKKDYENLKIICDEAAKKKKLRELAAKKRKRDAERKAKAKNSSKSPKKRTKVQNVSPKTKLLVDAAVQVANEIRRQYNTRSKTINTCS